MAGMTYKAVFKEVAVTALQDLFELLCPTDAVIEILSYKIGQSSDFGDAEAEVLAIEWVRGEGTVTSGSGGSTPTPSPTQKGYAAAGGICEVNNTTRMLAGSGALVDVEADTFNAQIGYLYQPTPEEREWLSPGDRMTVALPNGPNDSLTMSGTLTWTEYGG